MPKTRDPNLDVAGLGSSQNFLLAIRLAEPGDRFVIEDDIVTSVIGKA
jgi:hypothetical protein